MSEELSELLRREEGRLKQRASSRAPLPITEKSPDAAARGARERIAAIIRSPAARGKETLALYLATETSTSLAEAVAILAAAPAGQAPRQNAVSAAEGWDRAIAQVNAETKRDGAAARNLRSAGAGEEAAHGEGWDAAVAQVNAEARKAATRNPRAADDSAGGEAAANWDAAVAKINSEAKGGLH